MAPVLKQTIKVILIINGCAFLLVGGIAMGVYVTNLIPELFK